MKRRKKKAPLRRIYIIADVDGFLWTSSASLYPSACGSSLNARCGVRESQEGDRIVMFREVRGARRSVKKGDKP